MAKKILSTRNRHWLTLTILVIIFFIGTSSFNRYTQDSDFVKWASPDETANYVFSKLYAESGQLNIFEKYNLYAGDIMHPRSARSDQGEIKPVSFWGIILIYGRIAALFGAGVIPYLTPFIAGLGIMFFYLLVKVIFGRVNALLSAFLLASFPPFVYYTARSLFHNVLFTVLFIIGLYFLLMAAKAGRTPVSADKQSGGNIRQRIKRAIADNRDWWRANRWRLAGAGAAGIFFGLAAITRSSELLWIAPLLFVLWVFNIKRVGVAKPLIFLAFFLAACLPGLYCNKVYFGAYLHSGYTEMNQSIANIAQAGSDIVKTPADWRNSAQAVFNNIFHFGFHPRQSLRMFYYYFIAMFPWIFWPASLGLGVFFFKYARRKEKISRKYRLYLSAYALISFILIFYYGSWEFHDNPDPNQYTIGNSYTRYWLPVYLGLLPFASLFIMRLTKAVASLGGRIYKHFYRDSLRAAAVFIVVLASVGFTLWSSDEGLVYLARRQRASRAEFDRIMELTETNAAIVTRYHDKLLFPERKVVIGLFDHTEMVASYARLAQFLPLYYYNFTLPDKDFEYLNTRRLKEAGLSIEKVSDITKDFTLYKLKPADF